jgi:hypothetical protein
MWRQVVLVILVALVLVALIAVPMRLRKVDRARSSACFANVKLIGLAILAYASDHDGRLPLASAYPVAIMAQAVHLSYPVESLRPLGLERWVCPADRQREVPGYAYCGAWAGRELGCLATPAESVLLYDASAGQPAYRHGGYGSSLGGGRFLTVGYCDGRVDQQPQVAFTMANVRSGLGPEYYWLRDHTDPGPAEAHAAGSARKTAE